MDRTVPVKRASVSAAVEIFREHIPYPAVSFQEKHRIPSCKQCQRERTKSQDFRSRQKGKRKQNRANTPIVIQLKDTLKAAMQQKQRNKKVPLHKQDSGESTGREDADIETDNSSDRGDLDTTRDNQKRKNAKNLSAFIDVMEKAHQKETIVNLKGNLRLDNSSNEKLVAEYVLNNVSPSQNLRKNNCRKKSIVECENIDVICNDLTSVESTVEDTEESEISSTTSSSEIQSDSDVSQHHGGELVAGPSEGASHEFTTEELQKLAELTTGCPLIRYDCPPAACPQCQWYNHSQTHIHTSYDTHKHHSASAQSNKHPKSTYRYSSSNNSHSHSHSYPGQHASTKHHKFAHYENLNQRVPFSQKTASVNVGDNISTSDSDLEEIHSESSLDLDHQGVYNDSTKKTGRHGNSYGWRGGQSRSRSGSHKQLMDIDIAGKHHSKPLLGDHPELYLDSVYIDLTDTDVSFSVYYHHDLTENHLPCAGVGGYATTTTYCPAGGLTTAPHQHGEFVPYYSVPFSYHQYLYCSVYCPPLYSLPAPFCLQPEDSLPKTAMVPPEELANFNASTPPQRQWIPLARPEQGKPAAIFTVMCYNVLCDKYCTRQQYGYCPSWGLNWEYRKKGIMDEIRTCSADIIGLQEVETDQFYNYFKPELERDGYEGIFSPKSRARTMTEQERKHVDGCAIFFRTTKFSLVKEHLIEFNQLAMANAEGSDEMLNRVMTKDNIGLAALLETREGVFESSGGVPPDGQVKQPILVTTAHMHWDPEFSDVKLIQTMMLMSELKRIVEDSYNSYRPNNHTGPVDCNTIPILLCGDLNSLPESGVIEYLSSGRVASNHLDFKELGYEACLQTFNCHKDTTQLSHHFRLGRAYDDNIMPHTNYTFDFKGIIDYIFYSRDYMNLLGVLGPMDENWFHENKVVGCPHPHIPSDHFSLFVEFEMPVPYPDLSASSQATGTQQPIGSGSGNSSISSSAASRETNHTKLR